MNSQTALLAVPTIRRRLACLLYEALLMLGVLSVTFMVPHLALGIGFGIVLPGWILLTHVMVVMGGYFCWYWAKSGQTLAMQTWKLILKRSDGSRPTRAQLVGRYLLAWPSLLLYGAGFWWALFDRNRQFLHDRIAGTQIMLIPTEAASGAPPTRSCRQPPREILPLE